MLYLVFNFEKLCTFINLISLYCVSYALCIFFSGKRGRPKVEITTSQLNILHAQNYTGKQMAQHFGCSTKVVYRRLKAEGLSLREKYSKITEQQLEEKVTDMNLTGKSVHNQRIERLWRDIHCQVTKQFYDQFYILESDPNILLNSDNALHLFALHYVYLPIINDRLDLFRRAWNGHKLRTEQNHTPDQLWINGMLQNMGGTHTAINSPMGNTASLSQSLEEGLAAYGLNLSDIGSEDVQSEQVSLRPANIDLQPEMKIELQEALQDISKPEDKIKIAIDKLESFNLI